MNAYELADELWEKYLDNNECQHGYALSNGCPNDDCKEQALYDSATMLRQQADRIAELEKERHTPGQFICPSCGCKSLFKTDKSEWCMKYKCLWQSDYPVKQLTSERILEIADKHLIQHLVPSETVSFARAIIKEITE